MKGPDGEPIGCAHDNPLFDTHEYEVEFTDGTCKKYQANVIDKNLFAQVNDEGHHFALLKEVLDHHKDNTTIPISEGMLQSANGTKKPRLLLEDGNSRWELLCHFKDGSLECIYIYNKYIIKALILDLFSRVKKMLACTGLNMKLR